MIRRGRQFAGSEFKFKNYEESGEVSGIAPWLNEQAGPAGLRKFAVNKLPSHLGELWTVRRLRRATAR